MIYEPVIPFCEAYLFEPAYNNCININFSILVG